jgi:hypothetical protein
MLLAPTLTLNAPARGFDADATAFAAASGATDVAALSTFVKGVKELGLWDDMVCWPLRSSQNAGTGTTAYSLGGLGTFDGTLVNGPTWDGDGVTFDGTDDVIQIGDAPELRAGDVDFSVVASCRHAAISRNGGLIGKESSFGSLGEREFVLQQHNSNRHRLAIRPEATGDVIVTDNTAISSGVNYFVAAWHDANADTLNIQTDNNAPASLAHSTGIFSSNNVLQIGAQGTGSFYQGVIAFAAVIRVALNSDQRAFFRSSPLLLP